MPPNRPRTRAILVVSAMTVFLGTSSFLVARQAATRAPAQSQQADGPKSPEKAKPEGAKARAKSKSKATAGRSSRARVRNDPPGFYMGRPIAGVMSWEG